MKLAWGLLGLALGVAFAADEPSTAGTDLTAELLAWKNSPAGQLARANGFYKEKNPSDKGKFVKVEDDELARFKQKKLDIEKYQKRNPHAKFTLNTQFTLMTEQEFLDYLKRSQSANPPAIPDGRAQPSGPATAPKDPAGNVDWMLSGCVAPVKDQGACGSCWAFGAAASVEYEYCNGVSNHSLVFFSEQQMTSCTPPWGCGGGWPDAAMTAANTAGGMCTAAGYPYTSGGNADTGTCSTSNCAITPMQITPKYIEAGEDKLTAALDQRPITVILHGDYSAWSQYSSGVLEDCGDPNSYSLYHVVLAVGYGTTSNGMAYYRLKNQWATWWGDQGFISLKRNVGGLGLCSLATSPLYAEVKGNVVVNKCTAVEENTDYVGNDITSTKQATADKCCDDCEKTVGCTLFVWTDHQGGTCWLKHKKGLQAWKSGARASSLSVKPPACLLPDENVDYPGNDIKSTKQVSVDGCCGDCQNIPGCTVYVWTDYQGGTCWHKTKKSPVAEYKFGARAASLVYVPPAECGRQEQNTDYYGNDISNAPTVTAAACCNLCTSTKPCNAYSWSNGICYMKSRRGNSTGKSGVTSALANKCSSMEYDTDYMGNDISNSPATSEYDCCAICRNTAGCGAFTWSNHNGGTCWLKSGKGATTNNVGVVSAYVVI